MNAQHTLGAYLRLMRFDKPVGILLLWFPTAWALWIANQGHPSFELKVYFLLGTILMRAAGCIINDIADRNIDRYVKRTSMRPITTGEVTVATALKILALLLFGALMILLQLPTLCVYWAIAALVMTYVYPYCKRLIEAPQLVLGLAFSMGIPMAYVASGLMLSHITLFIFMLNFLWILAYDTIYAMADREDDLRIGVKSTAIRFAQYDCLIIMILHIVLHLMWLYIAYVIHLKLIFYVGWILGMIILFHQQRLIRQGDTKAYMEAFSENIWYGFIMWFALVLSE